MVNTEQQKVSHLFRWTLVDLSSFFLWIVVIGISIFIGGLGWTGISQKGNASLIYTPEFVSQVLFYLGCVGVITKGVSLWVKHPLLILVEALEYYYLGLICGICFLCSLVLPIPNFYDAANANRGLVAIAFGLVAVVVVIMGSLAFRKYKQIPQIESKLSLAQESYFRHISRMIFQYKWLLLAPLGLLILPFLFVIILTYIFGGDPFNGSTSFMLYGYYGQEWYIPPLIVGNIIAALGYGGRKLKSIKGGNKFRNVVYSISGGLLIFFSIGVYIILMLIALIFTVYMNQ